MRYALILILFILPLPSKANAPCDLAEYRQFDFWLGTWQVISKNDDVIRHNRISSINRGCALLEEYSTPSGYVGKSLNMYDKVSKRWYQTWTDSSGLVLKLSGGMQADSMVMTGRVNNSTGVLINKISWTPFANGEVRQHWQVSKDSGKSWQTLFDGRYKKIQ